jgi:hypothetical protein
MEHQMIEAMQLSEVRSENTNLKHDDATGIALGYAVLSIVILIGIYLASMSPGTAPGEFGSMAVFP